jgi:hypothetical protein
MPANLNALIRYKTINGCLYGGRRKWSISELIDACSQALAESRGRYEAVSERTLRDDIRVMRSDILGFNAPIAQKKGLYFYSDPGYSIMSISITDSGLAAKIINLLLDVRTTFQHPELETILGRLMELTGRAETAQEGEIMMQTFDDSKHYGRNMPKPLSHAEIKDEMPDLRFRLPQEAMMWGDVMGPI